MVFVLLIISDSNRFLSGTNTIAKILSCIFEYLCYSMAVYSKTIEDSYERFCFVLFQEFVFCTIWTFFYLLAASLAAANGRYDGAFGAAAFFGFAAMVAYGYDAFLKFNAVRSGALAQGERVVTDSSSTVTSPA
jgi:hypothetical protein